MTPEIWQDISTRIRNLKGDIVGQWAGDIDNAQLGNVASLMGTLAQAWAAARPVEVAPRVAGPFQPEPQKADS